MLLATALSFGSLLAVASSTPIQARDGLAPHAYTDVAQVLDRLVATVTTIGSHISAWPGNPKRANTVDQIIRYVPTIQQDCRTLLSDLQVGTDWIQKNKQKSLGTVDTLYLVPKLASLNNAVSEYKDALIEKRPWADTSSVTPELYDQLVLQKQWATGLSTAITQSLGITTSWLGGTVSDFFFGAKLDEAINAYADVRKFRPAPAGPAPEQPRPQGGPSWGLPQGSPPPPYYTGSLPAGPQGWPSPQPQQAPYQPLPYPPQGTWTQSAGSGTGSGTGPGVEEQLHELAPPSFEVIPPTQDNKGATGKTSAPLVSP